MLYYVFIGNTGNRLKVVTIVERFDMILQYWFYNRNYIISMSCKGSGVLLDYDYKKVSVWVGLRQDGVGEVLETISDSQEVQILKP